MRYMVQLCRARRKVYNVDGCDRGLLIAWTCFPWEGSQLRLLERHGAGGPSPVCPVLKEAV
jgi:hypothetical protein